MSQLLALSKPVSLSKSGKWRWIRYAFIAITTNGLIWGSALTYLKVTKPTYTSQWALILPGASSGVNVNLPGVGQASASSSSGLGSASADPRENYDYLFTSDSVLGEAARLAKLKNLKFTKPKIKLVDNTTLMLFEVTGASPQEAQVKSYALYQAMINKINRLRSAEMKMRDQPTQAILKSTQAKLLAAQKKISDYKVKSGLSFPDQVGNLSVNIEQLRKSRADIIAQEAQAKKRLQQLSQDLGTTPQQAADAFVLKVDQLFQANLKDYSDATASYQVLITKFGPNHPQILREQFKQKAAQAALVARGRELLGKPIPQGRLEQLVLSVSGSGRENLFQSLITVQSDYNALAAQSKALNQQIAQLEARLNTLAQRQSVLENLNRDEQLAQAVFVSTLAKLDLGKGDIFAAYPMIQMAVEPSLPDQPTSPKKNIVLAGAGLGSLLSSVGMAILWIRKPFMEKISERITKFLT